jgi:hypothetical protein
MHQFGAERPTTYLGHGSWASEHLTFSSHNRSSVTEASSFLHQRLSTANVFPLKS